MNSEECCPTEENRQDATKAKLPKSQSASSADGVTDKKNIAAVHKDSVEAILPYS